MMFLSLAISAEAFAFVFLHYVVGIDWSPDYSTSEGHRVRSGRRMPTTIPEFPSLTTQRLRLRAPDINDAEAFRVLLSIPEVTRFSNWPDAPKKAEVERVMRWMSKLLPSRNGCAWIIEDSASEAVIGAIRFNHFDKRWKAGEVGYELHPDWWGRGLMTEALRVVVSCGHRVFRLNRIQAWTLPGNQASDRVLEKAGFRYEGTLRQRAWFKGAFHDFRMFGRTTNDPATS